MADWLSIDSSHIHSLCGESAGDTLADALDGLDYWYHYTNHNHWFILDLGSSYTITKVRGRSNSPFDPTDIDIYVSDDLENWGDAVVENITTWQDYVQWREIATTEKAGRYVKVVIFDTEGGTRIIGWGHEYSDKTIFDVYGEVIVDVEISGSITGTSSLSGDMTSVAVPMVDDRPPIYDPGSVYEEDSGTWSASVGSGGGRYKSYLIVVGQDDDGEGVVYYG